MVIFALPKLSREIMAGGSALQQAEVKLEGLVLLVELRLAHYDAGQEDYAYQDPLETLMLANLLFLFLM